MIRSLILLLTLMGLSQYAMANIATAIAKGIEPLPATEDAKNNGVLPEDAVVQLITGGIETVKAVEIVQVVYGLTGDCGLTHDAAITQMTESGVPQQLASDVVQNRCGDGDCESTVAPIDSIVLAALGTLPEDGDSAPLAAMFSGCEIGALDTPNLSTPGVASSTSGGGTVVSPN